MKKIISLISAVAVAIACFTPVSFAAAKPTMNVTAEKITDFSGTYASYAEYANDYGLDVYLVTFTGTGIAMTTTTATMAKKLSGQSIIGATVKFDATSTATRDEEWLAEQYYAITPPSTAGWTGDTYTAAMAGTSPLYPAAKTAATVTANDETPALYQMIFAVNPEAPVTLTFKECAINIGAFTADSIDSQTTYKMVNSTLDMSQATLTLPLASAPTPVVIDDEGSKNTASGATGLTDLQGNTVPALSKNYGIAQFSTTIDTAANDYVLAVEDSNGDSTTFDVDFAEIGVEAASATVDFFAVVKSLTHTITSMVLQAVAKAN